MSFPTYSIEDLQDRLRLDGLNEAQLRRAKALVEQLLSQKQAEKRVVWNVTDRFSLLKSFPDEQYLAAAEFLCETARTLAEDKTKGLRERELLLTYELVAESEYPEWQEAWQNGLPETAS